MQKNSVAYIISFSVALCLFCSVLIAGSAVGLRSFQKESIELDIQKNVLLAASLLKAGQKVTKTEIQKAFERVKPAVVDLRTGEYTSIDPKTFDQQRAAKDPKTSSEAPSNAARLTRVPLYGSVYRVMDGDKVEMIVLPISGKGLWSTLFGFVALDSDGTTVRGITFFQHGETPGLGGEVDNPAWKAFWPGRKIFDEKGAVRLKVIKGKAGAPEVDPYQVDGISGSTITSKAVTYMIDFWVGEYGFGRYLKKFNQTKQ